MTKTVTEENSEVANQENKERAERLELKRALIKEENEIAYEEAMKMLSDTYVVINIGGKTTIYNKIRTSNNMMSVNEAREYLANLNYKIKIIDDYEQVSTIRVSIFKDWFLDEKTLRYESLTFDPEATYGPCGKEWNTWRGWKYEPKEGDCSLYLDHIKNNICMGKEELYSYVLDYMAQIIQEPKRKIFHSLAIKGQKGTGKSIFVQMFMELFGEAAVEISDSEVLTNQFNSILADRLLVYGDEAFWSGDRKNRGNLKNLISSDTLRVTFKFKDTITIPNYIRFIFTTNEDWAAPVEKGERRWVTLRCGEARINDRAYFGKMKSQMRNGGYNALMKLLAERDISKRDWSKVPETEASKEDMAFTTIGDNVVAESSTNVRAEWSLAQSSIDTRTVPFHHMPSSSR